MRIFQIQQRVLQLQGSAMIREGYREWLNRPPSVKELRYWHKQLLRGVPKRVVLQRFMSSTQVRRILTGEPAVSSVVPTRSVQMLHHLFRLPKDEFVTGLFVEWLDRTPKPEELQGYGGLLNSLDDYWSVFAAIALSQEAQAILLEKEPVLTVNDLLQPVFAQNGVGFVHRLTRELLARNPLRAEVKRFASRSVSAQGKEGVLRELLYSQAFRRAMVRRRLPGGRAAMGWAIGRLRRLYRLSGPSFVVGLYRELLGREPDPEGMNLHLAKLKQTRKLDLIRSFLLSPEAALVLQGSKVLTRWLEGVHERSGTDANNVLDMRFTSGGVSYPYDLSVVIPTFNQVELVQQCVASLNQTTQNLKYEIIVVDDGSSKAVSERLKAWGNQSGITVIAKPENGGFSRTVNAGVRYASGEQILLLNNDVIFHEPGSLQKLVQVMEAAPDIGIVGARLLFPNGTIQHGGIVEWRAGWFPHRYESLPGDYIPAQVTEDVLAVTGALMLVRHSMLDDIGLLSEDFPLAFEDIDLCFRARREGWRVIYCGDAAAIHVGGATRKNQQDRQFQVFEQKEAHALQVFQQRWQGVDVSPFRHRKVIYALKSTGVSGGIKNVFEHVNRLHDLGYDVELFALDDRPSWFPVRASFRRFASYDDMKEHLKLEDAIKVATWWETMPIVQASCDPAQGGRGTLFYLVQDLEDSYYPGDTEMQKRVESTYLPGEVHLLTISDWNQNELQRRYQRAAAKISIAIDSEVYQPRRSKDYNPRVILAVSRGSHHLKGFDVTIKAIQKVAQRLPDVRVVTFGIEPAQIPGVTVEHVQFPDDAKVSELYSNCGVFVQTSNHEGFGLPILEAMACGAPVVTTRADGNEEFCDNGYNCVLVNRGDVDGVANGIIKVLTTPHFADRIAHQGQRTAQTYAWGRVLFHINNEFAKYTWKRGAR